MSLHFWIILRLQSSETEPAGEADVYFGSSVITTQNPLRLIIAKFEIMLVTSDLVTCGWTAGLSWRGGEGGSLQLADVVDIQFLLITKSQCCLF
jgi:hypothetical protein